MATSSGRRGLPPTPDEPVAPTAPGRRALIEEPTVSSPRRAATPAPASAGPARRGIPLDSPARPAPSPRLLAAAGVGVLAVAVGVSLVVFGPRGDSAEPAPSTPAATTPSPSTPNGSDPPASTPAGPGLPTATAPPATASPGDTDAPVTPATPTVIDLGDTTYPLQPGWEIYYDGTVQGDRRLVRLRQADTDTLTQIVTLPTVGDDLPQACTDLMADHRAAYSEVAETLPVNESALPGGEAASCSFTGVRVDSGVAAQVSFTLLRRGLDSQVFIVRDSVPTSVPAVAEVRTELEMALCDSSTRFGVALTRCQGVATPGQGDG